MKLTEAETQALKDGKFIQREAEETSKKELAALLVVLVPRSFDEVVAHVANLDLLRSDRDVVAYKDLGGQEITPDQFRDAVFTAQEGEEVRKLSNAGAGNTFNLSKGEIASLQSLRSQHSGRCDRDPACVQAFNAAHSDLLYERMMAYRRGGLSAVAPYQREKNAAASPADELRGAGEALAFLKQQMPSLYKAFMVTIARSEYRRWPPGRPLASAFQASIAHCSNQTVTSPRFLSAASYSGQFFTRHLAS